MSDPDFESFYGATPDKCFRALIVAVGDHYDAEDLLAESYARAWERWQQVKTHPVPEAWIVSVALNLHRDRWRRARRRLKAGLWSGIVDSSSLPIEPRLQNAINTLAPQQRQVLALRVLLDLDTASTARILKVAPGTVTTHLHRALSALRDTLSKEEVY